MFDRLAGLVLRKPRAVLVVTLLLVLAAGAVSSGLNSRVTLGGYEKEDTESARAAQVIQDTFQQGTPTWSCWSPTPAGSTRRQAAGRALTERVAGRPR